VQVAQADLAAVKEHLERAFAQVAHDAGLRFETAIEAGAPEAVETDPRRLQQILSNLLSNAFKVHQPRRGRAADPARDIGVDAGAPASRRGGRRCGLFRERHWVGIPEENHGMIFDAFQQVDGSGSREHGGTGLGFRSARNWRITLGARSG